MKTIDVGKAAKPLRAIYVCNSFFLAIGILVAGSLVASTIGDITTGEFGFVSTAIALALYAPVTWLTWRTLDPIQVILYKPAYAIYWCTVVLNLGFAIVLFLSMASVDATATSSSIALSVIISIFAVRGALSVRKLRRIETLPGVTLAALVGALAGRHGPGQISLSMRVNPRKGFLLLGLAAVVLISPSLLPDGPIVPKAIASLSDFALLFAHSMNILGLYFAIIARANFQAKAESLLSVDRRPATLFLRSFSDDEKLEYNPSTSGAALWGPLGWIFEIFDFSLEGRLAGHFSASGPFIAVGSPKQETLPAGAARAHLSDGTWQSRVVEWMGSSRLIVVLAGITKWVAWEIDQAVRRGHADKLIVAFPEKGHLQQRRFSWKPPFLVYTDTASLRLDAVRAAFRGTRWDGELQALADPINIRCLIFAENGEVTVLRGRSASRNECQLAILASEYVLHHSPPYRAIGSPRAALTASG